MSYVFEANIRLMDLYGAVEAAQPQVGIPRGQVQVVLEALRDASDVSSPPSSSTVAAFGWVLRALDLEQVSWDGAVEVLASLNRLERVLPAAADRFGGVVSISEVRARLVDRIRSGAVPVP